MVEHLAWYFTYAIEQGGYLGAAFLMALESMVAPVPSELVMPFVGFLVVEEKFSLWAAILVTSLGSIIGSLISYYMGYFGGRPVVLRVGRYLLLNQEHLEWTERWFQPTRFVDDLCQQVHSGGSSPHFNSSGSGTNETVAFLCVHSHRRDNVEFVSPVARL